MKQLVVEKGLDTPDIFEGPMPSPGPGEVVIKNRYSVISSGTEKASIQASNTSPASKMKNKGNIQKGIDLLKREGLTALVDAAFGKDSVPIQIGYSSSGEIVETGKSVSSFHVGDRVASNGSHAEYVVVSENLCTRLPDAVTYKEGAFTVMGSIALHGMRLSETGIGNSVVVIGLGVIGQLAVKIAEAQGSNVTSIDPDELKHGYVSNVFKTLDEALTSGDLKEDSIDSVIITAGTKSNDPIEVATRLCRKKGKIVVVGDVSLNLSRNDFYYKELELIVSMSYGPGRYDHQYEQLGNDYPIQYVRWTENRNFQSFLGLIETNKINVMDLISKEVSLDDASNLYKELMSSDTFSTSVISYENLNSPSIEFMSSDSVPEISTSKIKVGIIGAGNFASSTMLPVLKSLNNDCMIVGIVSMKGLTATTMAKEYKIPNVFEDPKQLIESDQVDVVFIFSSHESHAELVQHAIENSKPVYVEKPLSITEEGLNQVEESIFNADDPKLYVGFNRRKTKAIDMLMKHFGNRSEPLSITYRFNVPTLPSNHWTKIKEIGGGRIVGEAIHAIDLASYITGSLPQSVSATSVVNKESNKANEDQVSLAIIFGDGSTAAITYFSEGSSLLPKEKIEVHGNNKSVIIEDFIKVRILDDKNDKGKLVKTGKGHLELVNSFFDYVKGASANEFTWKEIKSVNHAAITAQENINSGKFHSIF